MARRETAKKASHMQGDKPYQKHARAALPLLVRQAKASDRAAIVMFVGRFPAPGSLVESCGSHAGSRSRRTGGSREPWHLTRTIAPAGRCPQAGRGHRTAASTHA